MVNNCHCAPISVPVYEPSPYALWSLSFQQLSPACQNYLTTLQLKPSIPPTLIAHHRQLLAEEFWRSIRGVDMAIVSKFIEARQIADMMRYKQPSLGWYEQIAEQDRLRVNEVTGVLLPERQKHFDRFMDDFDALFWLETQLVGGDGRSMKEDRKRRDR